MCKEKINHDEVQALIKLLFQNEVHMKVDPLMYFPVTYSQSMPKQQNPINVRATCKTYQQSQEERQN